MHLEFLFGKPVFHKVFGLGVVTMESFSDEDWIAVEFGNQSDTVFKRDLIDSDELINLIQTKGSE